MGVRRLWPRFYVLYILGRLNVGASRFLGQERTLKSIPFAASSLKTAIEAIRANWCIIFVAFGFAAAMFAWALFLCYAMFGVLDDAFAPCADNGGGICLQTPNIMAFLALLGSELWTLQVLINMLYVTNAGTVGAWWFQPAV